MAYVTPQEVREYTGVAPGWFAKPDDAALDATLERWASQAEELIDAFIGTSYPESDVPEGVRNAALRIVSNMIHQARLSRRDSIVTVDEFGRREERPTRAPSGDIFTQTVKDDLLMYQVTEGAQGQRLAKGYIPFGGSLYEDEDDASRIAPDPQASQFFGTWDHLEGQYPYINKDQLP